MTESTITPIGTRFTDTVTLGDAEVRAHHDDGGDEMRPLSEVLTEA